MIRDFWKINTRSKKLKDEIEAIKKNVQPQVWKAIDSVRRIGNIGAHMEQDVDLIIDVAPDEADKLIKLIEFLFDQWYIQRAHTEELLNDVVDIAEEKAQQKENVVEKDVEKEMV